MDVVDATAAIQAELGDPDVQVAAIGPGAENGVRFAGLFCQSRPRGRPHRHGHGDGFQEPQSDRRPRHSLLCRRRSGPLSGDHRANWTGASTTILNTTSVAVWAPPSWSWPWMRSARCRRAISRCGRFAEAEAVSGEAIEEHYKVKSKACFACTIPCSRFLQVDDPRFPDLRLEGPEFEPLAGFTRAGGQQRSGLCPQMRRPGQPLRPGRHHLERGHRLGDGVHPARHALPR